MKVLFKNHIYESNSNLPIDQYIKSNYLNKIIELAQLEYDQWIDAIQKGEDQDEYFGGGICHLIAEQWVTLFNNDPRLEAKTIAYDDEVHVAALVRFQEEEGKESFDFATVDIPWRNYEEGGGYSFNPIPNVRITKDMVMIAKDTTTEDNWEMI